MWRISGLLCVSLVSVALAGCDPVLVREFRVTPAQVGTSTLEAKASPTLAAFDMSPFNTGGGGAFGFRRQWPNLATDRPGEISVTFVPESSGDAWLIRFRQWPVAHQTHFGANVESALVDGLTHSGYKVVRSK
jgi:hypothetical protein